MAADFLQHELPAKWELVQIRRVARIRNGADYKSIEVDSGGYPVYGSGGEFGRAADFLYDGDSVLFGRKGTINKPLLVSGRFWCVDTMFYTELGPLVELRFFYYYAKTIPFDFYSTSTAVPSMTQLDLAGIPMPLPPLEEQAAIADYLDRELAKSELLISEQERLIQLLRERRFALRVNLALRGIGPTELKESGLPWAGPIPSHWNVVGLSSVAQLESGHTPSRSRPDWWLDCRIPWVSLHDVGRMQGIKILHETVQQISEAGMAHSSARLLPAGSVVLSRDATVGRTAIMGKPMATSQHFAAWICREQLAPEYLWTLFSDAMQPFFDSFQNGSTIRTIGMRDLRAFRIPLPPIEEQRRIVADVERETAAIDTLISESQKFIELTQERQIALIESVVTGKRGWIKP